MINKIDKSLEEVWQMKADAQKDFEESGYKNYNDYLIYSVNDVIEEFGIKTKFDKRATIISN